MKESAHQVPNLGPCGPCPLDAVQPFFHCDRLYLFEPETSPPGQYPFLQIAFVASACRERLPPSALHGQFFQPIVSDEFSDCARPAVHLRGLLVGVDAQRTSCFEGHRFSWQYLDSSHYCLPMLASAIRTRLPPAEDPYVRAAPPFFALHASLLIPCSPEHFFSCFRRLRMAYIQRTAERGRGRGCSHFGTRGTGALHGSRSQSDRDSFQ